MRPADGGNAQKRNFVSHPGGNGNSKRGRFQ